MNYGRRIQLLAFWLVFRSSKWDCLSAKNHVLLQSQSRVFFLHERNSSEIIAEFRVKNQRQQHSPRCALVVSWNRLNIFSKFSCKSIGNKDILNRFNYHQNPKCLFRRLLLSHRFCREFPSFFSVEHRISFVTLVHLRVRVCMTTARYCWFFFARKLNAWKSMRFLCCVISIETSEREWTDKSSLRTHSRIYNLMIFCWWLFPTSRVCVYVCECNSSKSFRIIHRIRSIFIG